MKYNRLAITLLLVGATLMAYSGFTLGLWALCIALVLLPTKYDPAIQLKEKLMNKESNS